jgi:hypothetical protein
MAKSTRKTSSRSGSGSKGNSVDKLAKAAMSKEMLGAGLAAAAISASPAARRKIRDAGLDAADTASQAANSMMASATKLGSLIAEAVADAAQRVMTGKWSDDDAPRASAAASAGASSRSSGARKASTTRKKTSARKATTRKPAGTRAKTSAAKSTASPARKTAARKPAARKTARRRTTSRAKTPSGGGAKS